MRTLSKQWAAALLSTVVLSACGGGSHQRNAAVATPAVTEAVPAAASTDSAAATQYLAELTAVTPAASDTLEPVNPVPAMLGNSDTAEPRAVP
jgi:hypothetical protein